MASSSDVVVVGGGIAGIATAYFLGKAGIGSVVVEKDSVGSHASGFAYGGLNPLAGSGIPGPLFAVASEGMRLHQEFSTSLLELTGVNTEHRTRPTVSLCFDESEVAAAKTGLSWQQAQGYAVGWLEPDDIRTLDGRISGDALGAVHFADTTEVEPYRFVLALAQAAEQLGAEIRHGTVTGLKRQGGRVTSVVLDSGEIPCGGVVLAMGPWSGGASSWLEARIPVSPLKGQIIRLRAPGAPLRCSVGWSGSYATTKTDGLLWAGTTEEEVGFNETPTVDARDKIMAALLRMIPSLVDAQLVQQTACLRPLSADGELLLGPLPQWDGVYIATGAGRKGILLGPAMGRIVASLVAGGTPGVDLDAFDPARFSSG